VQIQTIKSLTGNDSIIVL